MKHVELTWKGWLVIALVASLFIGGLFLFFYPSSPVARGLGTVPESEPFLVRSNATANDFIDLWSPVNSVENYVNIYYEQASSGPGYLFKGLKLSDVDLAAFIGIDSLYTSSGRAKIVYIRYDTSGDNAWLSMLFKDIDGTWRAMSVANRDIAMFFDKLLPAVIQRLGYPLP
jgi:hypothetical protein